MSPITLLATFFGLLATGLPIYLTLGVLAFVLFWLDGKPLLSVPQLILDQLNSSTLIAIPFFVIAATIMERGGIAKALVDCAHAWVGGVRGGLALVCVLATTVFAAISGSSVATALAMGTILVPAMLARNYARPFAIGVTGASSTLGILIPPSLAMIVFAIVAEESVPRLFLAGVVPGLLQASLFALWIVYHTRRAGYTSDAPLPRDAIVRVSLRALPALMLPVIVLGGIYGGFVTVSEAAALSAIAAIVISVVVYRGCRLREIPGLLAEAMRATAVIVFIIMMALAFGHWLTGSGIPMALVEFVTERELQAWQFLLFMNLFMLLLGMFLEVITVILITVPLVLALLGPLGIDPIHYAVVVVVNMELALLTPPIGLNLFVLASITQAPITEVIRGVWPFIVLLLGLLGLVTYIPELSLWLPRQVYGH
jgi:C4-dicarboxylate transporter, DctM subunit